MLPESSKRGVVRDYGAQWGLKVLVETGTFEGEMVKANHLNFAEIYTIELAFDYFDKARAWFAGVDHIHSIYGDSARVLPKILRALDAKNVPALFWLDAHYSGEDTAKAEKQTPIVEELEAVFEYADQGHVVLVDDARLFADQISPWPDYPSVEWVQTLAATRGYDIDLRDDIIRLTPGTDDGDS